MSCHKISSCEEKSEGGKGIFLNDKKETDVGGRGSRFVYAYSTGENPQEGSLYVLVPSGFTPFSARNGTVITAQGHLLDFDEAIFSNSTNLSSCLVCNRYNTNKTATFRFVS